MRHAHPTLKVQGRRNGGSGGKRSEGEEGEGKGEGVRREREG